MLRGFLPAAMVFNKTKTSNIASMIRYSIGNTPIPGAGLTACPLAVVPYFIIAREMSFVESCSFPPTHHSLSTSLYISMYSLALASQLKSQAMPRCTRVSQPSALA